MKIYVKLLLIWIAFNLVIISGSADEGMWLPHQMMDLNLKSLGLELDPAELYKTDGTGLMSAVVHLGGATGEFVSSRGLILTNHHVAFGAIQRASSEENDYIRDGFLAASREEEIPARGYTADVLLGYEDITERINAAFSPDMSPLEKYKAIEKATKELIAEAEKQGPDIRATVADMYHGNQYFLFKFKRIKDIRIVYAPPQDLGNFGGDIDNWMWPRHTCDFTFLRAYVSPENEGVDYSPENVPYQPKVWLKISKGDLSENDFTFVMGYPGRTYRNNTLAEVSFDMENMKKRMELFRKIIAFLEEEGKDKREIQIRYASKLKGLNNSLKNYQGKLEGIEKINLLQKKKAYEDKFKNWVKSQGATDSEYEKILPEITSFMEKYKAYQERESLLSGILNAYTGPTLLAQAYTIYRTSTERQKPDMEREPSFQERNIPYIKRSIELAERGYHLETDKKFFKFLLEEMLEKPKEQIPGAFKDLILQGSKEKIDGFVEDIYRKTVLSDPKKRLELIEKTPEELNELNDPLLDLAEKLEEEMKDIREEGKALYQERKDLKKIYLKGLLEMTEGKLAPDANSTIRFTYGSVEGYSPRDAVWYLPQTTLTGIIEKETGEFPFHVPEKLKILWEEKDFGSYMDPDLKDIPSCFLNTTCVTGGNSGSPTLNAKGELVGIVFDMTYESVTGDYYVIPELQRTISVDIRYVLFVTEKFAEADWVIKELDL